MPFRQSRFVCSRLISGSAAILVNKICTKFENDVSKLQEIKRELVSWGCVAGVGAMEHDVLCMAWLFLLGDAMWLCVVVLVGVVSVLQLSCVNVL